MCIALHLAQPGHSFATTPIGEIQLGDNVPGVNPVEAPDRQFGVHIEPENWRAVSLTAFIDDGSVMEMQLLRPAAWLAERRVEEDGVLAVRLAELSFCGEARVDRIDECPPIRPGPGHTVTGIFRHHAESVLTLVTADCDEFGVTSNHPIWSEDRQEFVPAGDLRPGETLRHLSGTTTLQSLTRRPAGALVYNLEVETSHVYHVSKSGLLVHNTGDGDVCDLAKNAAEKAKKQPKIEPNDFPTIDGRVRITTNNGDDIILGITDGVARAEIGFLTHFKQRELLDTVIREAKASGATQLIWFCSASRNGMGTGL